MAKVFNIGNHVFWNFEAGPVHGATKKKPTSDTKFKVYKRRASSAVPQDVMDRDNYVASHRRARLQLVSAAKKSGERTKKK